MAKDAKQLFREQALKKVSSPEKLDELIQITDSTGWLALLAFGGLVIAAVIWGFLGSIPNTTAGQGVFIKGGALDSIVAPTSGEVRDIAVAPGDSVSPGQRVARVGGTTVPSPFSGKVMQVLAEPGTYVSPGTAILSIEPHDAKMQVIAFLSLADAKKINPGMKVQIAPSTVKKEEFGSILGTVNSVAEFPSTMQSLKGTLVNEELAKAVAATDAPVEVRIDPEPDPHAPSGYKWTSSGGPPMQISTGTLGSVTVIISEQMPISMILPWLKSLMQ